MSETVSAETYCPVQYTVDVNGGKWKPLILYFLLQGPQRISQLQRLIPNATRRLLVKHLRELEADDIIHREVYQQVPPKVEYDVTDYGRSLEPILVAMQDWGRKFKAKQASLEGVEVPEHFACNPD